MHAFVLILTHRSKIEAELEAAREREAKLHAAEAEAARTRERLAAFNAAMQEVRWGVW
jgi:hypothetical protein